MKRLIVWSLWYLCGLLDALPGPLWEEGAVVFYRRATYGCLLGLAHRAMVLEERWDLV